MNDRMAYRYFQDPGHGWLEVPRSHLQILLVADKITEYSYVHGDNVYLEEDCDMMTFLEAAKRFHIEVDLIDEYQENTPIRDYARYTNTRAA